MHDGRVEVMKWTKAADEDGSPTGGNGLREQERSSSSPKENESREVHEQVVKNGAEVSQDDRDLEGDDHGNWNDVQDGP